MEACAGLVAGSHNRNELIVIRRDSDPWVRTCGPALRRRGMSGDPWVLLRLRSGVDKISSICAAEAAKAAEREGLPDLRRRRRGDA